MYLPELLNQGVSKVSLSTLPIVHEKNFNKDKIGKKLYNSILLDNAIRHSKGGDEVWLTLTKEHGFAKLSVINKGDEISAEQRDHIFERFYRVDTARNGENMHYGLGLAIAKAITTTHKGNIAVHCFDGFVEFRVQIPTI